MSVPTISSVSPTPLFVGGQRITVVGTNFQTPYALDLSVDGPIPKPPDTVSVTVNGRAATQMAVKSSTELTCLAPAGDAGTATVVLQNLDAMGAPIGGETVTYAEATYARADLSKADDFERFTRAVIQMLKREVIENVVSTVSVDYTDDAGKLAFNVTQAASLPALSLVGPMTKRNKFYGDLAEIEQQGSNFLERRYMRTSDLIYKLTIFDNNEARLHRLGALVTKVLENNTYFELQADPDDVTKGYVYYELDAGDLSVMGAPNSSDLRAMGCEMRFSSFTFQDVAGFPGSAVDLEGQEADTVTINLLGD